MPFFGGVGAMRAPIGIRIRNHRKSLGLSQVALARAIGISASYLNLIEGNKRQIGGALLIRMAQHLKLDVEQLSGESEQRLVQDLAALLADPVMEGLAVHPRDARELVAQSPDAAAALSRLYRAYEDAMVGIEAYANRIRSDPLFSRMLHQILSQITAVRSAAEIVTDTPDLSKTEQRRFLTSINREAHALSEITRTIIGYFEQSVISHRSVSPSLELDDLIFEEKNYFPRLEEEATRLRKRIEARGRFGETTLAVLLEDEFGIELRRGDIPASEQDGFSRQYRFDRKQKVMWFQGSARAATRQFQIARLYAEQAAPDIIEAHVVDRRLTSPAARQLARRAMASYLAGGIVLPYSRFLEDAERHHYDIDYLSQSYAASFEQAAHRLVTLRRPGQQGIPFGFLRSDPSGRLSKHLALPGLLLPATGHACPLWAIYSAFRTTNQIVRQVVVFPDGSRYLFIAKAISKRLAAFQDQPFHSSIMLACDILHADRTTYGKGLKLDDAAEAAPVGPTCRLCIRRDCAHRQEEMFDATGAKAPVQAAMAPLGLNASLRS